MAYEIDLGNIRGPRGGEGPAGPAGPQGPAGPTPNLSVGNVHTLPPGSAATVTRRANSPDYAPILDFGLPAGAGGGDMTAEVYDPTGRHQDVFAYCDTQAGRLPATLVVAAHNSRVQTRADFVCSGESDQNTIRLALAALPAAGGKLLFLEGDYLLDCYGVEPVDNQYRLISVEQPYVAIEGMGAATRFQLAAGAARAGYSHLLFHAVASGFRLRNLCIDGLSAANPGGSITGLRLGLDAGQSILSGLTVSGCDAAGIDIRGEYVNAHDNVISGCGHGCLLTGAVAELTANLIRDNSGYGVQAQNASSNLVGNRLLNNAAGGIRLTAGGRALVRGNLLIGQPLGIGLYAAQDVMLLHNFIRRDAGGSAYAGGEYSIRLESCSRVVALGNWAYGKALSASSCTNLTLLLSGSDWNPS